MVQNMYIEPNSTIIIMKDVPLDPSYTDTLYFASLASQTNVFRSWQGNRTFTDQTYQRRGRGYVRLQVSPDAIHDYNYMMYQNTSYSNKWFYAFIKSIEYVNDSTAEIQFEVDVMQTWFFDVQLQPSYVEREHSATDEIGENIAPESVDLGPIICDGIDTVGNNVFSNWCIVIAAAENMPND